MIRHRSEIRNPGDPHPPNTPRSHPARNLVGKNHWIEHRLIITLGQKNRLLPHLKQADDSMNHHAVFFRRPNRSPLESWVKRQQIPNSDITTLYRLALEPHSRYPNRSKHPRSLFRMACFSRSEQVG